MKIVFPTIERVKNGAHGILPSRFMLSLSEVNYIHCWSFNNGAGAQAFDSFCLFLLMNFLGINELTTLISLTENMAEIENYKYIP